MLSIDVLIQILAGILVGYGYLGIFIVSLISNSIPYVGLPYLALFVFTAPILNTSTTILAIMVSALGATIGKLIILFIGRGAHIMLSAEVKDNLVFFNRLFRKWGVIAIFLFAALPLPDDVLYIPLGVAGYRTIPYTIAVFIGKIVVTGMAVIFGKAFIGVIEEAFKVPLALSLIILVVVTITISYITIKINWKIVFESYHEEGIVKGTWRLVDEVTRVFKLR